MGRGSATVGPMCGAVKLGDQAVERLGNRAPSGRGLEVAQRGTEPVQHRWNEWHDRFSSPLTLADARRDKDDNSLGTADKFTLWRRAIRGIIHSIAAIPAVRLTSDSHLSMANSLSMATCI